MRGSTLSNAEADITATFLVVGTVVHQQLRRPGTVQTQNPKGATTVAAGSAVNITVSTCSGGGHPK